MNFFCTFGSGAGEGTTTSGVRLLQKYAFNTYFKLIFIHQTKKGIRWLNYFSLAFYPTIFLTFDLLGINIFDDPYQLSLIWNISILARLDDGFAKIPTAMVGGKQCKTMIFSKNMVILKPRQKSKPGWTQYKSWSTDRGFLQFTEAHSDLDINSSSRSWPWSSNVIGI